MFCCDNLSCLLSLSVQPTTDKLPFQLLKSEMPKLGHNMPELGHSITH